MVQIKRWRVAYFYLATGMEGRADRRDYGVVSAATDKEAIQIVVNRECRGEDQATRDWFRGCLSAMEV